MWYIHPVEYYSAVKRIEVPIHAGIGMNLENTLHERKKTKKTVYILYDSAYIKCLLQETLPKMDRKWISSFLGQGVEWGVGEMGFLLMGMGFLFRGVKVF